jgi:hypothetical protein
MRVFDPWSDDDPAVQRGRGAQDPPPPPQPVQDAPRAPEPSKRDRIAALAARVRAGDLSALADLRRLVP